MKLASSFQREKFKRDIDNCTDIEQLKAVTKDILDGYFAAKGLSEQLMKEKIGIPNEAITQ